MSLSAAGTAALIGLGSTALSAGASAASSAINSRRSFVYTSMLQNAQNTFYKEMQDQAYERQKELLEYDSPANQMARLKEAGLNPNLAYGSLGESTTTQPASASGGSSSQFSADKMDMQAAIAQGASNGLNYLQQQNAFAEQKRVNDAHVREMDAQTANYILTGKYLAGTLQNRISGTNIKNGELLSRQLEALDLKLKYNTIANLQAEKELQYMDTNQRMKEEAHALKFRDFDLKIANFENLKLYQDRLLKLRDAELITKQEYNRLMMDLNKARYETQKEQFNAGYNLKLGGLNAKQAWDAFDYEYNRRGKNASIGQRTWSSNNPRPKFHFGYRRD